ncbi:glycosyltransferase family 2 protein [Patescibacteria group bacterium]|nr:glycosyltransferase family 2 protein [Patescibacteria group bacterium]MCL5798023.1 glycosyltransferase family 2 protein [Patescibacteria group bacterium]
MRLLIGIPAYNEEKMIGVVISSLPKRLTGVDKVDIVVVDDGSEDRTGEIAQSKRVTVLRHIINRGLGGALKTIFAFALERNYDILVTFDADGQHESKYISDVIKPILSQKSDVVIGTRWKSKAHVPFSRRLINQLANVITFILYHVWTSDSQSGFRAFNKNSINKIKLQTDGMEVSSEFFKEIKSNNLRFSEISIIPVYSDYSLEKGQRLSNAPSVMINLLLRLLR